MRFAAENIGRSRHIAAALGSSDASRFLAQVASLAHSRRRSEIEAVTLIASRG